MLYSSSKSDVFRLDEVARLTGVARGREAGAALLALTNRIWRTNTVAARFISDSMVATWSDNKVLRRDMPELLSEEHQYRLLAWYCCVRPLDSGCLMSCEPVDPILDRMAREIVAESPHERLPYTALMMSIYHFRPDVREAVALRGEGRPSLLGWYYSHGVRELNIIHHVSREERAALNAAGDEPGYDGLPLLCRFALEWLPHPDFDLASREDRAKAGSWFTQSAAQAEPFATLAESRAPGLVRPEDTRSARAGSGLATPFGVSGAGADEPLAPPGFGDDDGRGPNYRVDWQVAEYFDRRGAGNRLLLSGEWFAVEELFRWSHAPWASLVFQPSGPVDDTVNIGLLLHPSQDVALLPDRALTIFVNGSAVWDGLLRDAAGRELILRVSGQMIRSGAGNLLQFHVPEPFVPAELMASADSRKLGVALRRLWIGRAGGRQDAGPATARRRGPPPAQAGQNDDKFLVLRGDLRSHTGYAKATRALARLVPGHFRTIGVDIHPDPADNQAAVPFAIVPEAEALRQVAEHPSRCAVLHAAAPDDFAVWPNARNVGWFFWETDTIPYLREWPLRLALMDAIWAPTAFIAGFVRATGYRGPVHAVAWPDEFAIAQDRLPDGAKAVITSYFEATADLRRLYRLRELGELRDEARLLFLAVQSLAPRKGLPLLLSEWRGHVEGSGGRDILVLRLAFRHATGLSADWQEVFLDALATAGFRRGGPVRIALIPTALADAELTGLYRAADAFVSMTYGEGFGGPVVEALQNDCPVIAPRHTGLCDLIPENYPLTVASARLAVALRGNLPAYPHSASWHIPKAGEMRKKIEEFAALPAPRRRALAQECKKHAMSFCWTPVVRQRLAAALDDLDLDGPGRAGEPVAALFATAQLASHAAD